jgi:hypothetical protein
MKCFTKGSSGMTSVSKLIKKEISPALSAKAPNNSVGGFFCIWEESGSKIEIADRFSQYPETLAQFFKIAGPFAAFALTSSPERMSFQSQSFPNLC